MTIQEAARVLHREIAHRLRGDEALAAYRAVEHWHRHAMRVKETLTPQAKASPRAPSSGRVRSSRRRRPNSTTPRRSSDCPIRTRRIGTGWKRRSPT
jgi:hypothetical protein